MQPLLWRRSVEFFFALPSFAPHTLPWWSPFHSSRDFSERTNTHALPSDLNNICYFGATLVVRTSTDSRTGCLEQFCVVPVWPLSDESWNKVRNLYSAYVLTPSFMMKYPISVLLLSKNEDTHIPKQPLISPPSPLCNRLIGHCKPANLSRFGCRTSFAFPTPALAKLFQKHNDGMYVCILMSPCFPLPSWWQ